MSPAEQTPPDPQAAPKSLLRQFLRWSLVATAVLIVSALGLLAARPEFLLFHPKPHVTQTPEARGWDYEAVTLVTKDGEELGAWYLPPPSPSKAAEGVILYAHGNAGNIGDRLGVLEGLRALDDLNLAILIFDYRGFGDSTGRATTAGTRLDIDAAWMHLVAIRGHEPDSIVLWGRSLGGAVVIDQAARVSDQGNPPRALLVESTFTSTLDIGEAVYPWLPVRTLGRKLDYPSKDLIPTVTAPVLVAHSKDDTLVPVSHGEALFEAAKGGQSPEAIYVELSGDHNEGHLSGPRHTEEVASFLRATAAR